MPVTMPLGQGPAQPIYVVNSNGDIVGVLPTAALAADGAALPTTPELLAALQTYNGTTLDLFRGNTEGTLLASAVRAVSTNGPDTVNYNAKGVSVVINVTVEAAAETLALKVQGKDPVSGNYYTIADAGVIYTAATEAPTETKALIVYPGVLAADLPGIAAGVQGSIGKSGVIPRTWRAVVTHSASGNWTYSLGYSYIL